MIYFLQAGKNGPIKIGFSDKLYSRVKLLQVGCPYELSLLWVYNGRQYDMSELFKLFFHEHIRGEWFRPGKSILGFKEKYFNDCYPYPITNNDLYKCREEMFEIAYRKTR